GFERRAGVRVLDRAAEPVEQGPELFARSVESQLDESRRERRDALHRRRQLIEREPLSLAQWCGRRAVLRRRPPVARAEEHCAERAIRQLSDEANFDGRSPRRATL